MSGADAAPAADADREPDATIIEYAVEHDTRYTYSTQVAFAQHLAHLTPMDDAGQRLIDFALDIEPPPVRRQSSRDTFGNERTFFALAVAHETLRVRTRSRVRLRPRFDAIEPLQSPAWESVRDALLYVAGAPYNPAAEFAFRSELVGREDALRDYAAPVFGPGRPLLDGAIELMHRIHADFRYDTSSTDVSTATLAAFEARAGVCQDFSHVMIGCLRSLGLAARYVSGYLHTQARFAQPPGEGEAPAAVVGADASHAWVAVYCPRWGWLELDPTNDAIPGTGHVRLATGRDYRDVAPLRGVVQGGGEHQLHVAVRVTALAE